ncbi:MAG: heat shock protein HspQ [Candidatus Symbiodolus clandestinus]
MIATKFDIGQQVRHKTFGYLGVIVDVDAEFSLSVSKTESLTIEDSVRRAPWYTVVTENNQGDAIQAYVAEMQLDKELFPAHPEQPILDDFANAIQTQLRNPQLRH